MIFADAHESAVPNGVMRCFNNSGQSCNAPSRMLVEQSRYAQAVEEAKATAEAITVGARPRLARTSGRWSTQPSSTRSRR